MTPLFPPTLTPIFYVNVLKKYYPISSKIVQKQRKKKDNIKMTLFLSLFFSTKPACLLNSINFVFPGRLFKNQY